MWKIKIIYSDKSKITLTGKHRDIPLELALHYHNLYVVGRCCESSYQQYPKKDHDGLSLEHKLEELSKQERGI